MTERNTFRVVCAVPGCGISLEVNMFHPRFPKGPFHCAVHARNTVGAVAYPEDDDHAVTLEELDEDGAVVAVDIPLPKKW